MQQHEEDWGDLGKRPGLLAVVVCFYLFMATAMIYIGLMA